MAGKEEKVIAPFPLTIGDPDPEPADDDADGELDLDGQLAQMRQDIADGQTRMQATQDFYASAVAQLAQTRQQNGDAPIKAPSLDDLPDPTTDPDKFKTALSEYVNGAIAQGTQQITQQSKRAQDMDGLMSKFSTDYPDLAKRDALLRGATAVEAQALRARGIQDVEAAVLANPDDFLKRVAARMNTELGIAGSGENNGKQHRQNVNRTGGVSSGTRTASGQKPDAKPAGFVNQLRDKQLADGLY